MNELVLVNTRSDNAVGGFLHRCYEGQITPEMFAAAITRQHPSLQQAFFKCMMEVIITMAREDYPEDARNHASHELSRRIVESGIIDDCYLAYL